MRKLVMALDQGTTSSRTIIFDQAACVVASANEDFDCIYPRSGWVEQDPLMLWKTQHATIRDALAQARISMEAITAIGITNQRETVVAWDRQTGAPVGNAIVWQCRRTADFCDELKQEGFDRVIRTRTGLVTDAYFSGTKMRWIMRNRPEARRLADQGRLAFGTVDAWLVWNLTGGQVHAIDASNAARTMLYDIHRGQWDDEIIKRFEIPRSTLPQVVNSSGEVGTTLPALFGASIPIAGIAGDQQAALFGQACFDPGMAKNTYGTGCFLLMNTGATPVQSTSGLLTTIAWRIGDRTTYALEGSVFVAGALIQWLRDGLGLFARAEETDALARAVSSSGGVRIVPAFVGLGAPHWDPYARGTIVGLTRDTNRRHIVRAALEAIAFQTHDILKAMEADVDRPLSNLRADGGASANDFLCQFQADILRVAVTRPRCIETTAMGAAFLAGLAAGIWPDTDVIRALWQEERVFQPQPDDGTAAAHVADWHRAIERAKGWIQSG